MTYPLPYEVLLDQINMLYWVSARSEWPHIYSEMIYGRLAQIREEDFE